MPSEYRHINDPAALRDFARSLQKLNGGIESIKNTVNKDLDKLGQTWRDKQYHAFKKAFVEVSAQLNEYVLLADEEMKALEARAKVLDEWLNQ